MATLPISLTAAALATSFVGNISATDDTSTCDSSSTNSCTASLHQDRTYCHHSLPPLPPFPAVPPDVLTPLRKDRTDDLIPRDTRSLPRDKPQSAVSGGGPAIGEILVGLRKDVDRSLLSVVVVNCVLPASPKHGNQDWYVKVKVQGSDRTRHAVKKRRTGVQRALINPQFNEIFHFHDVKTRAMLKVCLMMRGQRFQKDILVGRSRISLECLDHTSGKEWFQYYPMYYGRVHEVNPDLS